MKAARAALLAVSLVAGCASHPVREPPAPLASFEPVFAVRQAWSADIGGGTKDVLGLRPALGGATVYAAGPRGRVSAFDADSGRRLWETDLGVGVSGGVGLGKTLVAVGTREGQVIALARDSGKRLWSAAVSSAVLAPPAVGDTVIAVQTVDGRVSGLSSADGKHLWVYERSEPALSLRGTGTPVLADATVFAGFASGRLAALRVDDGRPLWDTAVAQPHGRNEIERLVDVDASPLVFADAVYAASYQGKLVAVNPDNGNVLWSRDISTYTGMASDGTDLFVTNDKSEVLAFDRGTGAVVWTQKALHGRRLSAPVVFGDAVVLGDYRGYVHWLARSDGRFLARDRAGSSPFRAPGVVGRGMLFMQNTSGTLFALRPAAK